MNWRFGSPGTLATAIGCAFCVAVSQSAEMPEASLRINAGERLPYRIPRELTGKFCEHLGANIYNGMDAQILRNPTFADYPFAASEATPDGIVTFQFELEKIEAELRRQAMRSGWPESDMDALFKARADGLACFWSRFGNTESVRVSPDTAPAGQRAQRLELRANSGIKQWTWLPLHRQRKYEFELLARSPDLTKLTLSVGTESTNKALAESEVIGLTAQWSKFKGILQLPENAPADRAYCLTLSVQAPGQLVIGHLFLQPADHIDGADPDVVKFLKAAHLPLLRWPGGNFVSAYHWLDGIGPVQDRPTLPNYAWGGIEPNTFGTDEFIEFCRAVGCEPMICINAGTGTPEEAAAWVEYCNGPVTSPMGARRAANGHPEPFHVRHWEVGNELWGRWQARWTTASGYVDRYERFASAMRQADTHIELHACGAPVFWGKAWNDTLIAGAGGQLSSITDHPLIGGDLSSNVDPLDVFRDFMLVPDILESKWGTLRDDMRSHGIENPHLAVTELQMFAHLRGRNEERAPHRLSRENLVNPGTLAEALYDTLIYHAAVRLQPFVELITHSATVNHGGGLRKERERVYANPCYYANLLFANLAAMTPVKTELECPKEQAPVILPDLKQTATDHSFATLDAIAAQSDSGDCLISIVHRGTAGPVHLTIQVEGISARANATVSTLSGAAPWASNTLEDAEAIKIVETASELRAGSLLLAIQPFSVVQVRLSVPKVPLKPDH